MMEEDKGGSGISLAFHSSVVMAHVPSCPGPPTELDAQQWPRCRRAE